MTVWKLVTIMMTLVTVFPSSSLRLGAASAAVITISMMLTATVVFMRSPSNACSIVYGACKPSMCATLPAGAPNVVPNWNNETRVVTASGTNKYVVAFFQGNWNNYYSPQNKYQNAPNGPFLNYEVFTVSYPSGSLPELRVLGGKLQVELFCVTYHHDDRCDPMSHCTAVTSGRTGCHHDDRDPTSTQ